MRNWTHVCLGMLVAIFEHVKVVRKMGATIAVSVSRTVGNCFSGIHSTKVYYKPRIKWSFTHWAASGDSASSQPEILPSTGKLLRRFGIVVVKKLEKLDLLQVIIMHHYWIFWKPSSQKNVHDFPLSLRKRIKRSFLHGLFITTPVFIGGSFIKDRDK